MVRRRSKIVFEGSRQWKVETTFAVRRIIKEDFVLNGMLFKNEEGLGFEYTQYLDMDQINWYGYISWEDLLSDENNVKVLIEPRMTSRGYPLDEDGNVIGAQE